MTSAARLDDLAERTQNYVWLASGEQWSIWLPLHASARIYAVIGLVDLLRRNIVSKNNFVAPELLKIHLIRDR